VRRRTRGSSGFLAVTTVLGAYLLVPPAHVQSGEVSPPELSCRAAVLIDPETRQLLYQLNADERRPVASLTKMMTALLIAESGKLEQTITVSERAAGVGETTMHLEAGEQAKLRHLLMGAMLTSANDAATACAEAVSGSVEAFVERMNERADELGLTGTHFLNPHGLHHDGHYSTARDMALLAVYVMGRPELRPIMRTRETTVPWPGKPHDRKLVNRNKLLHDWPACDGIKTGYTKQAGDCLAASAYVDGWRLICVVLDSKDKPWDDARALLEWGFDTFYKVALVSKDLTKASIEVEGGAAETVVARATEDIVAVMPRTQTPGDPVLLDHVCQAPVRVGDVVGRLGVAMPNGEMRSVDLVAVEEVAQSPWALILSRQWSYWVMAVLVALAVGVLVHGAAAEAVGARWSG